MRLKRTIYFLALIPFLLSDLNVHAGGFPVRPGRLLASVGYNYFYADQVWDKNGVKSAFPLNGSYTSNSLNLYLEYGLSRKFTLFTSIPYLYVNTKTNASTININSLGDAETGIRYYLFNIKYKYYFSVQAAITTPLYQGQDIGYNQPGAEIRFAVAGTGKLFGTYYYFNAEDGVRQFFDSGGPFQDRYAVSFGQALDRRGLNVITLGATGVYSSSNFKGFSPNLLINRDYNFNQGSLSYSHTFNRLTMMVSGNKFITGRNIGDGYGGGFSLMYKIDAK